MRFSVWHIFIGVSLGCRQEIRLDNALTTPGATILQPTGGSVRERETVTFLGKVVDAEDPLSSIRVSWTSDISGLLDETPPDAEGKVGFSTVNLGVGVHVITLNANDSGGLSASDTITLEVTDVEDVPTIQFRKPLATQPLFEGDSIDFEAYVSDEQDEALSLSVSFWSDVDGALCTTVADAVGIAKCANILSSGEHLLSATVTDLDLETATALMEAFVQSRDAVDDDGDGFNEEQGDCDDNDPSSRPGAVELADVKDNNCNGQIDEGTSLYDDDGDCACENEDDKWDCSGSIEPSCFAVVGGDCDDGDDLLYPDAPEYCDEIDNDCDGRVDEEGSDNPVTWYLDRDGDSFGTLDAVEDCAPQGDYRSRESGDCDDANPAVNPGPGIVELPGDGVDQDCDGEESCYVDSDRDGARSLGVYDSEDTDCSDPGEALASAAVDCEDRDARIQPSAVESPGDGIDQNCDSRELCYSDADDDGARGTSTVLSDSLQCERRNEALASAPLDCNEGDRTVFPGAVEGAGDGRDQNCDGREQCFVDADRDGARIPQEVESADLDCVDPGEALASAALDCRDDVAAVYPGAVESPGDGIDQNCDSRELCYSDADDDGARGTSTVLSDSLQCEGRNEAQASAPLDCNEGNRTVFPGAVEGAGDGRDQNCDGREQCFVDADRDGARATLEIESSDLDCIDPGEALASAALDCRDDVAAVYPGAEEVPGDERDQNCDGTELCYYDGDSDGARSSRVTVTSTDLRCDGSNEGTVTDLVDCADSDASISPMALEVAGDGVDQNCDTRENCFVDGDRDGYRHGSSEVESTDLDCVDPGEALRSVTIDCNDADRTIRPDASEIAGDRVDQNCDGRELCFADADDDGYRPNLIATTPSGDLDCSDSGEALATDAVGDCNDDESSVRPGATEAAGDGIDQNCDGAEICYRDGDGDQFRHRTRTLDSPDVDCSDPGEALVSVAVDCNDSDAVIYPGAVEIVGDGVDQSCDGTELCFVDADLDGERSSLPTSVPSLDLDCSDPGEALASRPATDCNDLDATVLSTATEIVGDNFDQNCDGAEMCYRDADLDGARTSGVWPSTDSDCWDPGESLAVALLDCNDSDSAIRPGAGELPGDDVDQDCDGRELCYRDSDGDGFRSEALTVMGSDALCDDPGESLESTSIDCDDNNSAVLPGAIEIPGDEYDQNCNGQELCYRDSDQDGYRHATSTIPSGDLDCRDPGEARSALLVDCRDDRVDTHPGATEIVGDNIDQDCNGVEYCFVDVDNDGYRPDGTARTTVGDADCNDPGEATVWDPTGDCGDSGAGAQFANPGSSVFRETSFLHVDGRQSFDYNCDGSLTKEETDTWECEKPPFAQCIASDGWANDTVPSCGQEHEWWEGCEHLFTCYAEEVETRRQACR